MTNQLALVANTLAASPPAEPQPVATPSNMPVSFVLAELLAVSEIAYSPTHPVFVASTIGPSNYRARESS